MADLTSFGVVSIATALTNSFKLRAMVEEGDVILDEGGEFAHACTHDKHYQFDAQGAGDFPADFAPAGAGPAIAGLTGGVTIVDRGGSKQTTGEANSWTASGEHAPSASA